MAGLVNVSAKIDASGLNRALGLAQGWSKRTPAQATNTAGYWIAVNTKNATPFSSVQRIDQELAVVSVPRILKSGKISTAKSQRKQFAGQKTKANPEVPLAVLIVQARANPASRYNTLTNSRYAHSSPFKGVSRAAGRAVMAAAVSAMIKLRHKSSKFILSGWIPAVRRLLPFSVQKFLPGSLPALEGQRNYYGADLGGATPALSGQTRAVTVIENDIGSRGKQAGNFDRAMQQLEAPILQAMVDREGWRVMDYYLKKSFEQELQKQFNAAAA